MSPDNARLVVRRLYEVVLNQQNLAVLPSLLAPGFNRNGHALGHAGMAALLHTYFSAFPDLTCTIESMIADGDQVAVRMTWHGAHRGPWLGQAASGKRVSWTVLGWHQVRDGRIARSWVQEDTAGLLAAIRTGADPDQRRREVLGI